MPERPCVPNGGIAVFGHDSRPGIQRRHFQNRQLPSDALLMGPTKPAAAVQKPMRIKLLEYAISWRFPCLPRYSTFGSVQWFRNDCAALILAQSAIQFSRSI